MQLDWLADVLRAQGLNVLEHVGWSGRTNKPFYKYTPVGLLNHHTAGSSVLTNYPDPPWYPNSSLDRKCNLTIRGDGTVVVLNAGYAYDSGYGDRRILKVVRNDQPLPASGPIDTYNVDGTPGGVNPGMSGNPWFIDIEVQHLGNGDSINPPQREALIGANIAICEKMGWDPRYRLIGHSEWTKRKIDPLWGGFGNPMLRIRTDTWKGMEARMAVSDWAQASWDWAKARFSWSSGPKDLVTVEQLMVFLKRYDESGTTSGQINPDEFVRKGETVRIKGFQT